MSRSNASSLITLGCLLLLVWILTPISICVVVDYTQTLHYEEHTCSNTVIHQEKHQITGTTWYEARVQVLCLSCSANGTVVTLEEPPQRRIVHASKGEISDWLSEFGTGGTRTCFIEDLQVAQPRGITNTLSSIGWWIFAVIVGCLLWFGFCGYMCFLGYQQWWSGTPVVFPLISRT